MSQEDQENIVVREILNKFFEDISQDSSIPENLIKELELLREEKKIARSSHLKNLLIDFSNEESEDEV